MKKALIVLLALAVAGGLFAQEVVFTGEVLTGTFFKFGDSYDDPIAVADDDDSGDAVHATFGVTYDADEWGLKIGSAAGISAEKGGDWIVTNAYGWFNFLEKMLNLKAGLIDDGVWSTGGWIDTGFATGGGMRLEVLPIPGLNLGAFLNWPDLSPIGPNKIADFMQETVLGFEFDGGIFTVSAAADLYSEASSRADFDVDLTAGFGFSGLDILNIYVGFLGESLSVADNPTMSFGVDIDLFIIENLGLGVQAGLKMMDGLKYVMGKPFVSFGLGGGLSIGAEIKIEMGEEDCTVEDIPLTHIKPAVWGKYDAGGGWLKAGYGFDMATEDGGDYLDHYLKLIFGFSF